jgi:pseudouridine-5'-phosphate glycosidase
MDRQRVEDCLKVVAAYRASGRKASEWAPANGVTVRELASWSAHAARWQARLDGVQVSARRRPGEGTFVAAMLPASRSAGGESIRVEVTGGGGGTLLVHWPMGHTQELASLLREMRR